MKVAVLSEADADEAVVRTYAGALLGIELEGVGKPYRRRVNGGWTAVEEVLVPTIRSLHYNTEALGLVVVCDSDDEPAHEPVHETAPNTRCRLCKLRTLTTETIRRLKPAGRILPPLRFALGLAVPCLEAWLLHGTDAKVSERAWTTGLATGRQPYTRDGLKVRVYGSDRAGQEIQTLRGVEEARRTAGDLDGLVKAYPGFGALAEDLRRWAT